MSSFEWMELQSLSADIAEARKRLAEARSLKDDRLIRTLEQEITAAEAQRARIVMQLSTHFADNPEQGSGQPPPSAEAMEGGLDQDEAAQGGTTVNEPMQGELSDAIATDEPTPEEPLPDDEARQVPVSLSDGDIAAGTEWTPPQYAALTAVETAGRRTASAQDYKPEGGTIVWDQLTPSDLERAKTELVTRRNEMLARHAEELKALESDGGQLEELERAITAFLRKFTPPSDAEVVKLGEERELRQSRG